MIERFQIEQFITLRVNAEALNIIQVAVDHMLEDLDDMYVNKREDSSDVLVRMALMTQVKQELAHKKLERNALTEY